MADLTVDIVIDDTVGITIADEPVVDISTIDQPFTVVTVEGPRGFPGSPGGGVRIYAETPSGAIDGTNAVFTTAAAYQDNSSAVYLNGLRETHYTETGATSVTFDDPPMPGDSIAIDYLLA